MIRRFLLADDDQDDVDIFREALEMIDPSLELMFVNNGKELVELLLADNAIMPDIIFLDINMPIMNGWECLEALKSRDQFRHTPVILYSTTSSLPDARKALQSGASSFYEKPSSFEQFKDFLGLITSSRENLFETLKMIENTRSHKLYVE